MGCGKEILGGNRMGQKFHVVIQSLRAEMARAVSKLRFWMGFNDDMGGGMLRPCGCQHLLKCLCVCSALLNRCITACLINHQDKPRLGAERVTWHTTVFCELMFGNPCHSRRAALKKRGALQRLGIEEIFQGAGAAGIEVTCLRINEQAQRGMPAAARQH